MYSTYASSSTIRMSDGTAATNRARASGSTTVLVGLFGLQMKISRVRSVTAASMASRSWV
jgi:hypothetical protein